MSAALDVAMWGNDDFAAEEESESSSSERVRSKKKGDKKKGKAQSSKPKKSTGNKWSSRYSTWKKTPVARQTWVQLPSC